ncbi:hypothetical protein CALVIDRAFT_108249 [Calocera viscosa TUFC12733]|uniref:BAH domain-containing protein n=1 Tax=Calocera viscosa (strain TUFC12733) TaxID=1330018 RepID=A0A167MDE3_CALVF|nr:hypothetical protein CALVIDRAFT_108249 [Calocera viscosa TUFC12733]
MYLLFIKASMRAESETLSVVVVPSSKAIGKRSRHELTEIELWRGRILEIRIPTSRTRSRNDNQANEQPKDVWVIVAWYYSPLTYKTMGVPTDQRGYRKGDFGKRELIFTPTHTDPVHIDTLNGTEAILDYDEKDYDQDDIPEEAFYKRSVYDTVHQIWEDGPPTRECICKQTFKVYDDQEMHYCPRAGCHKWYHEACLEKHDFMIRERALRKFEDEWEATFDEEWLGDIKEEVDALPRGNSIEIPKRLESYARRPIMKGGKHGVNGNAAATFRARWIIHQARKEVPIPDKYKDFCKYKRRSKSNGGAQAKERVRRSTMVHFEPYKQGPFLYCFICPSCKKAI